MDLLRKLTVLLARLMWFQFAVSKGAHVQSSHGISALRGMGRRADVVRSAVDNRRPDRRRRERP
jgi:hypothetical protein